MVGVVSAFTFSAAYDMAYKAFTGEQPKEKAPAIRLWKERSF